METRSRDRKPKTEERSRPIFVDRQYDCQGDVTPNGTHLHVACQRITQSYDRPYCPIDRHHVLSKHTLHASSLTKDTHLPLPPVCASSIYDQLRHHVMAHCTPLLCATLRTVTLKETIHSKAKLQTHHSHVVASNDDRKRQFSSFRTALQRP